MTDISSTPGVKGTPFEIELDGSLFRSMLTFKIDPNAVLDEGWHIIGDLEFEDPEIIQEGWNRYGYRYSKLWNCHCYSVGYPGGLDESVFFSRTYIPVIDALKHVLGVNDDTQDNWHGSALFRRKLKSTRARFIGHQWFNLI